MIHFLWTPCTTVHILHTTCYYSILQFISYTTCYYNILQFISYTTCYHSILQFISYTTCYYSKLLRFISYTTCYYSVQQPISHSLHVLTVLAGRGLNQFQLVATLSAGDQPRLHRVSCQAQSMHSAQSF